MKRLSVTALVAACLGVSIAHPALGQPAENCLFGCPVGAPAENQTIARSIYTLSNNPQTKFADWVAYRVDADNFNGPSRRRNWSADADLDQGDTITPSEYAGVSDLLRMDRGHQAPLASFKGHADWAQTNTLSNITPQSSQLNQGPWKDLEEAVRDLAENTDEDVFVITGPLYEWLMLRLPGTDKDHVIPSGYWKVIAVREGMGIRASSFYFYQSTPRQANHCDHMRSIDFIEAKAGLDFFPDLVGQEAVEGSPSALVAELGC